MTYTHNSEADFASSELARLFVSDPLLCYAGGSSPSAISASATAEPAASPWPHADGLISILEPGDVRRGIALEYKRVNEGLHGLLTGIGQVQSYIHKGYNGAALVIPRSYPTHQAPSQYVKDVLDGVLGSAAIGVFDYEDPDTSNPSPFAGRLRCIRPMSLLTAVSSPVASTTGTRTQWAHVREGSTTRDGYLRFLQTAKALATGQSLPRVRLPAPLVAAIRSVAPGADPVKYLANTADDRRLSRIWEHFWFTWILTPEVLTPWVRDGSTYRTPGAFTRVWRDDQRAEQQIFEGRADGLKENLVELLNIGAISEAESWQYLVQGIPRLLKQKKQGIRDRAHSFREDLDSSLLQLEWIDADGLPTDRGYKYMTICERYGGANSAAALEYFGATLLQTGRFSSFLHYVARLSERRFAGDPLAFTRENSAGKPTFNEESYTEYLGYLQDAMENELKVIRKVSGRARPRRRTVFQAELTVLRNYGFVSKKRHRLGVGIPIDWERVLDALNVEL